ncbi:hypothetical protein ACFLYP_03080 [Chloroflexota bacterium]
MLKTFTRVAPTAASERKQINCQNWRVQNSTPHIWVQQAAVRGQLPQMGGVP